MSANQLSVILALTWVVWGGLLCRHLRVSWIPTIPFLSLLGLGLALLINRFKSPAGVIFLAVGLLLPLASTLQIVWGLRSKPKN